MLKSKGHFRKRIFAEIEQECVLPKFGLKSDFLERLKSKTMRNISSGRKKSSDNTERSEPQAASIVIYTEEETVNVNSMLNFTCRNDIALISTRFVRYNFYRGIYRGIHESGNEFSYNISPEK